MTINNDTGDAGGTWQDLFQLQAQYSARLTEETLKYLRSLQSALSPRPPGTVVRADGHRLTVRGRPGGSVAVEFEIENRQQVHTPVTPSLSPFIGDDGSTWYPQASFDPAVAMLAPGATSSIRATVELPAELGPAVFLGSILLLGFSADGVPVEVTVVASEEAA